MTDCTYQTPSRGHPLIALADSLAARVRQYRRRRGMKRLLELDAATLHDIGVTRGEVEIALQQPLAVDAATELHRMSLERRRRKM